MLSKSNLSLYKDNPTILYEVQCILILSSVVMLNISCTIINECNIVAIVRRFDCQGVHPVCTYFVRYALYLMKTFTNETLYTCSFTSQYLLALLHCRICLLLYIAVFTCSFTSQYLLAPLHRSIYLLFYIAVFVCFFTSWYLLASLHRGIYFSQIAHTLPVKALPLKDTKNGRVM